MMPVKPEKMSQTTILVKYIGVTSRQNRLLEKERQKVRFAKMREISLPIW